MSFPSFRKARRKRNFIIEIKENTPEEKKGDVNGDGNIDSTDYLIIKSTFLGKTSLNSTQYNAADIDSNGIIDTTDYLRVKSHFLGDYRI